MKKIFSILLFLLLIISLCSCDILNTEDRISVEVTENRVNKIKSDIKNCLEKENIIYEPYNESFEDGYGNIDFTFDSHKIWLDIDIYNDRFNPIGDDYEEGVEKFKITYTRKFLDMDNYLKTDNEAFKIMPVVLSNVLDEDVTESELKEFLSTIKSKIPNLLTENADGDNLVEYNTDHNDISFTYLLGKPSGTNGIDESIYFSGKILKKKVIQ